MGELLSLDRSNEERDSEPAKGNPPLMIALACALLLMALFVAVMEAEGQGVGPNPEPAFGAIDGRVIASDTTARLSGVRLLVKRVHAGVANFYFDRITGADGSFKLAYLLPGIYTLEVDPRSLPDGARATAARLLLMQVQANSTTHADILVPADQEGPRSASARKRHD